MIDLRHRFPAVTEGDHAAWARFDGPAGTQVVDSAIQATSAWQRSGNNANSHGAFAAAQACDELAERVKHDHGRAAPRRSRTGSWSARPPRRTSSRSPGRSPATSGRATRSCAPSSTTIRTCHPGSSSPRTPARRFGSPSSTPRPVGCPSTRSPIPADRSDEAGSRSPVPATRSARCPTSPRSRRRPTTPAPRSSSTVSISRHTRRSTSRRSAATSTPRARTSGTARTPASPGSARSCSTFCRATRSARHPTPARSASSSARPPTRTSPRSTPLPASSSTLACPTIQEHERRLFERLLDGLLADDRVTVYGPHELVDRAPTLAFNVDGYTAEAVAQALAARQIAVWDGDYYALEAMDALGIDAAVRAGHRGLRHRRRRRPARRRRGRPLRSDSVSSVVTLAERLGHSADTKLVILSCDDLGSCHAANVGVYAAIRRRAQPRARRSWSPHRGRSTPPGLYEPSDDIGVHLTLNAEHPNYRWGPVTHAPSLLSGEGGFPRDHRRPVGARRPGGGRPGARRPGQPGDRRGASTSPTSHLISRRSRCDPSSSGSISTSRTSSSSRSVCRRPSPPSRPASRSGASPPTKECCSRTTSTTTGAPVHANGCSAHWSTLQPGVTELHVQPAIDTPEVRALTVARRALDRRPRVRHRRQRSAAMRSPSPVRR